MPMCLVENQITKADLIELAKERFGDLVKAVVDVERCVMSIGGELHSDEEAELLEQGSQQRNLWGVNLYPHHSGKDFIEFDSVINIRPAQGNPSRDVCDPAIRQKIFAVVQQLIKE